MKHVTTAEKSLLVSDDAADTLVLYAAHLAQIASADTVQLRAIGADGSEVVATFLLNSGLALMVESTHSHLDEPDNAQAVAYMVTQMGQYELDASGFDQPALDEER